MGKYDRWDRFFADLDGDGVRMSLEHFEEIGGVSLPPSARVHAAWWSGSHHHARWVQHGWKAKPRLSTGEVIFERVRAASSTARTAAADLVLVGCVASKQDHPAPAKDLYTSNMWNKRRSFAEASGKPWFILSAEYGLVDPDQIIAPYDRHLASQPAVYRERWSRETATQIVARAAELGADSVEIHAGAAYADARLVRQLRTAGIEVQLPMSGLRRGEQLAWYRSARGRKGRASSAAVVRAEPAPEISGEYARLVGEVYRSGALGESWADLPEAMQLPPTDGRQQRLWLTFSAAVDRARDAAALWASARRAWDQAPWVFDPAEVVRRPLVELAETLRSFGVTQRHAVDAFAWRAIGESLASTDCPSQISDAIQGRSVDAAALLEAVGATWPQGTAKFPLLSGPKIAPLWVRMMAFPGGAQITGIEVIPVAVDTHVQRVAEMLGLVPVAALDDPHRTRIQRAWFASVSRADQFGAPGNLDGTAAGLDPALWALGKEGCSRCERQGAKTPVGSICGLCVLGRVDAGDPT